MQEHLEVRCAQQRRRWRPKAGACALPQRAATPRPAPPRASRTQHEHRDPAAGAALGPHPVLQPQESAAWRAHFGDDEAGGARRDGDTPPAPAAAAAAATTDHRAHAHADRHHH